MTREWPGINITDWPTRYELTLERAAEVDRALGEALRLLRAVDACELSAGRHGSRRKRGEPIRQHRLL